MEEGTGKEGRKTRKPRRESSAFERAVRAAHKAEHGKARNVDIAPRMGISESALSQHFSGKQRFEQETLERFLRPIGSETLRKAILAAHAGRSLEAAGETEPDRPLPERAARLYLQNRPAEALALAKSGLSATHVDAERWTLSLVALRACFRLDLPGDAMEVANGMREWGEAEGRPGMVAAAFAASARAMRRTTLFTPDQVQAERAAARERLRRAGPAEGIWLAAAAFAAELLESEDVADAVRLHESGKRRDAELRGHLSSLAERRRRMAATSKGAARALQLETMVRLGLGETAEAERSLESALEAAGPSLPARLELGHLKARLLAANGETEEALRTLRRMAELCERDSFTYLGRLAQTEIARLTRPRP